MVKFLTTITKHRSMLTSCRDLSISLEILNNIKQKSNDVYMFSATETQSAVIAYRWIYNLLLKKNYNSNS